MKTLMLTTPLTRNRDVLTAQEALTRSKWGNFKPGPIDGVFGEQSAGACRRAKFWLGYPESELKPIYGDMLHNFLTGAKSLPLRYQLRRTSRLKQATDVPLRLRALSEAKKHLGVVEHPDGSNNVLFSRWYMNNPHGWRLRNEGPAWCAMFVTYAYIQAGCKALNPKEARYAFCPFWVRDARLGVKGQALLTRDQVKPGDVVLYDWGRDGTSDHVGMFDAWTGDGKFRAIEGNTSPGNESNGGKVMMRDRTIGNVIAFVRAEV